MRRVLVLLGKCYPRAWRERYGVEFDALMEDVEPDLRELSNVLGGAVKLQLQCGTGLWKITGAMALLGMVVAMGAWKIAPERYLSSAVIRVTQPAGVAPGQVAHDLEMMQQEILSRSSIAELIQRPSLDLYRGERQRIPMEDVIEEMRHDIKVTRAAGEGMAFKVSFAYADRFKAQAVVRELTTKFTEQSVMVSRNREAIFRQAWKEEAPPSEKVEVTAPATDPHEPEPRSTTFLIWGASGGLVLGLLVFAVARWPRAMRQVALGGLAGCALAGAASFLTPEVFVSEGVMRITPPIDPKRWYAGSTPEAPTEWATRVEKIVRTKLRDLRPEDLRIEMISPPLTVGEQPRAFRISATAGSRIEAQAVVREVITGFTEQYINEEQERQGEAIRFMAERKMGPNLEVLDPASFPSWPVSPNRVTMALLGLPAGLMVGAVMAWRRSRRGPQIAAASAPAAV